MFNFPWTNFHELNLDWILSVVKEAKEVFDNGRSDIDYAVETADEAKEIATQAAEATIPDNSISTQKIQDYAVNANKLSNYSVTEAKLQNASVSTAKLADGAVNTPKIADGAVTYAKLAADAKPIHGTHYCKFPNGFTAQWGSATIPAGSVYITKEFAVPFTGGDFELVVSAAFGQNGRNIVATYGSKTPTSVNLYVPTAQQADQVVCFLAIGYSE